MAKFLFLLGSSLLFASSAYAQVGVRAGATWLSLMPGPIDARVGAASMKTSGEVGYQLGVYYQLALTKHLSLIPEVQFSRERQHVSIESNALIDAKSQSDYNLSLSYFNVPILARLTFGPVYLEAGPQVSLLVGGRGEGITRGYTMTSIYAYDIDQAATDRYKRFDAGICLGVGVKLPAGLGASLRAYQGMRQVNSTYENNPTGIPYTANNEYRQVLQAALTYQLPTGQ